VPPSTTRVCPTTNAAARDPRVICTPHTVGLTRRWNEEVFTALAAGVTTVLGGGRPANLLNPEALRAAR
jgi:phosphoglycerate dehydrogenase-like enzyme